MQSLLEWTDKDVNKRSLKPTATAIQRLADAVVRNGNLEVPGYAVIPETRHIVETPERATRLQANTMRALLAHLRKENAHALRVQPYTDLTGRAASQYYKDATVLVDDTWSVFPGTKTAKDGGAQFHFDDMRTLFTSLAYLGRQNAIGGTLQIIDLLRLSRELAMPVESLISYHRLSIGIGGGYKSEQCPREICALVHPQVVGAAWKYRTVLELDNERFPFLIFTNRVSDGLIHTASSVRKRNSAKPHARPFTFVNILYCDPWQLQ